MDIQWKSSTPQTDMHRAGGVVWLSFKSLDQQPWLLDAFSTRLGGVSKGKLGEMNLGFDRGDDPENVNENFRRFSEAVGFPLDELVCSEQTHTTNVVRVGRKDRGMGFAPGREWHDVDGLMTDESGIVLCTSYADCVPLYFADPVHHAIALSHSGWRGTAHKMGRVTIEKMGQEFGTKPQDLICVIGPSICQDCYEVSADAALQFDADCIISKGNGKYQLDLWKANRKIMTEAGVPSGQIAMPDLCTCCCSDFLYSHRASHGERGQLCAFLSIRSGMKDMLA